MDELMTFRVYLPSRGNAVSIDRDGEVSVRMCAPGEDRAAVLALIDALGSGDGTLMRLVVVNDNNNVGA